MAFWLLVALFSHFLMHASAFLFRETKKPNFGFLNLKLFLFFYSNMSMVLVSFTSVFFRSIRVVKAILSPLNMKFGLM